MIVVISILQHTNRSAIYERHRLSIVSLENVHRSVSIHVFRCSVPCESGVEYLYIGKTGCSLKQYFLKTKELFNLVTSEMN